MGNPFHDEAGRFSSGAAGATAKAEASGSRADHLAASQAHDRASSANQNAAEHERINGSASEQFSYSQKAQIHDRRASFHQREADAAPVSAPTPVAVSSAGITPRAAAIARGPGVGGARNERDEAVHALRATGATHAQISAAHGVSGTRVAQILRDYKPGGTPVTGGSTAHTVTPEHLSASGTPHVPAPAPAPTVATTNAPERTTPTPSYNFGPASASEHASGVLGAGAGRSPLGKEAGETALTSAGFSRVGGTQASVWKHPSYPNHETVLTSAGSAGSLVATRPVTRAAAVPTPGIVAPVPGGTFKGSANTPYSTQAPTQTASATTGPTSLGEKAYAASESAYKASADREEVGYAAVASAHSVAAAAHVLAGAEAGRNGDTSGSRHHEEKAQEHAYASARASARSGSGSETPHTPAPAAAVRTAPISAEEAQNAYLAGRWSAANMARARANAATPNAPTHVAASTPATPVAQAAPSYATLDRRASMSSESAGQATVQVGRATYNLPQVKENAAKAHTQAAQAHQLALAAAPADKVSWHSGRIEHHEGLAATYAAATPAQVTAAQSPLTRSGPGHEPSFDASKATLAESIKSSFPGTNAGNVDAAIADAHTQVALGDRWQTRVVDAHGISYGMADHIATNVKAWRSANGLGRGSGSSIPTGETTQERFAGRADRYLSQRWPGR